MCLLDVIGQFETVFQSHRPPVFFMLEWIVTFNLYLFCAYKLGIAAEIG